VKKEEGKKDLAELMAHWPTTPSSLQLSLPLPTLPCSFLSLFGFCSTCTMSSSHHHAAEAISEEKRRGEPEIGTEKQRKGDDDTESGKNGDVPAARSFPLSASCMPPSHRARQMQSENEERRWKKRKSSK